jgi:hypothetical protein
MRSQNTAVSFLGMMLVMVITASEPAPRVGVSILLREISIWLPFTPGPKAPSARTPQRRRVSLKCGNTSDPNGTPCPPGP